MTGNDDTPWVPGRTVRLLDPRLPYGSFAGRSQPQEFLALSRLPSHVHSHSSAPVSVAPFVDKQKAAPAVADAALIKKNS